MSNKLADPWWRLNNLYYITPKAGGAPVKLKLNWAQRHLYENMWYLNLVLKARQIGFTTFIQIFMLDRALFNDNQLCGVVAHNKQDAEAFFKHKIKFAYDNLPDEIKEQLPAKSSTVRSLEFPNGSEIRVGTSMRSGTYQYLHISEFGKLCAKYPDKAEEVITGTLNSIAPGQMAFIESTAEGPHGEFYDMCRRSEELTQSVENNDTYFTKMDWKFFFYPWYRHPDYVLTDTVETSEEIETYFKELKRDQDIELRPEQRAWYAKKYAEQGAMMRQEYPSTPAEAFERTTDVAILGSQLRTARREKRITRLPVVRSTPVNTFWDLGRNDVTAIWFHQHVGAEHRFIYYTENRLQDLTFYVQLLRDLKDQYGWHYNQHYLPHDVEVTDLSSKGNKSRLEILQEAGLRPTRVVPRVPRLQEGIEMMRNVMSECYFDIEGCEVGLQALAGYEWTYDQVYKVTRDTPARNWARNGADAFRQFAQGYRDAKGTWAAQIGQSARGGPRKYMQRHGKRGTPLNPSYDHIH